MPTSLQSPFAFARHHVKESIDRIQDLRLNIDTMSGSGARPDGQSLHTDTHMNMSCNYLLLARALDGLKLSSEDCFYDVGCGFGRVLCVVARLSVRRCIGIELDQAAAERAQENLKTLRGRRSPAEVRIADASKQTYDDLTAACLFNPFGGETLAAVLEKFRLSLAACPRRIRFAYINPKCSDVVQKTGWLRCTATKSFAWTPLSIEFWENQA